MVGPLALLPTIPSQSALTLPWSGRGLKGTGAFRSERSVSSFGPAPHLLGLRKTQVFQRKIGLVGRQRESNPGLAWYSASTLRVRFRTCNSGSKSKWHKREFHFIASPRASTPGVAILQSNAPGWHAFRFGKFIKRAALFTGMSQGCNVILANLITFKILRCPKFYLWKSPRAKLTSTFYTLCMNAAFMGKKNFENPSTNTEVTDHFSQHFPTKVNLWKSTERSIIWALTLPFIYPGQKYLMTYKNSTVKTRYRKKDTKNCEMSTFLKITFGSK